MKELAEKAGVSRPAVSAVLNNSPTIRVSAKTREKILKLVDEMKFVPNYAAQQLKKRESSLIGMVSVSNRQGLIAVLQDEVASLLQLQGFEVLNIRLSEGEGIEKMMGIFRAREVDGIMAFTMKKPIKQTQAEKIPVVYCSHLNDCGFDVGCDTEAGGYLAARHLLEHGRRRIMFLELNMRSKHNQSKFQGVLRALNEAGIEAGEESILLCAGLGKEAIVNRLKVFKADAVICCNDFAAAELMKILYWSKIKVPDDIALVGFDGYSFCLHSPVSLATVVQPIQEQARHAVKIMMERIRNKEHSTEFINLNLAPRFQPGGSCGCSEQIPDGIQGDASPLIITGNES